MGCSASTRKSSGPCTCSCHDRKQLETRAKSEKHQDQKDDPRIPLTGRQVFLLNKSWKGIARNMIATGVNMFISLFEKNHNVRQFFDSVQSDMTLTEIRESRILEKHVKGVMLTIDEAMTNMDDAEAVIELLTNVGKTHLRFANFDPNVFWMIKEPFLLAVKETLGDRYTLHMADIYDKAITFILSTLIKGFDSGNRVVTNGVGVH